MESSNCREVLATMLNARGQLPYFPKHAGFLPSAHPAAMPFPLPHLDRFCSSCLRSILSPSRSSLILQDAGDFFSTGFQSIPSHFFSSAIVYSSFSSFYSLFYCDFMEESFSHRMLQKSAIVYDLSHKPVLDNSKNNTLKTHHLT